MNFPVWTKPGIYGALIGAVGISILGFTWGGWTTDGNAQKMAETYANEKVTLALVPVCLETAAADPQRLAKLTVIREANGYNRRKAIMETGWATRPGDDSANRDLAEACIEKLELDVS